MHKQREILAPISPGELLDKIAILTIKEERIADPAKLTNVRTELDFLRQVERQCVPDEAALEPLRIELKQVNETLWEIEDEIRLCEREGRFESRFIELARAVYKTNDRRAALKRRINEVLSSALIEEKSYADYE